MQLSGILAPESKAVEAIAALKEAHPKAFTEVGFYSENPDRVLVFFVEYSEGAEEAVSALSARLGCPAFYFHIHDEDLWMYRLFNNGSEVDRFNTSPGYWAAIDEAERNSWSGNPAKIAEVWRGVAASDIDRYLVDHEADGFDGDAKAYEEDKFSAWDCWQLVDFTKKLGLPYPPEDEG